MNAPELLRLRLQSLLARGLASSEIAARVGLAAASEVWGGGEPRDRPAWYLWLRDAPGAWQLELASAEALDAGGSVVGRFTVRHYPSSSAPVFACFSPEERAMAAAAFDATCTPRIELAFRIPDALFTVGSVEWALEPDGESSVLALSTLDRLRTRTDRGDVVRDVPGWELGFPVFSLLAALHAQVDRRAVTRLRVSRQPGFEQILSDEAAAHRDAPATVQAEVLALFSPRGDVSGGAERLLEALRDPAAEVVFDGSLSRDGHPHHVTADPRVPIAVSHAWFGGEQHAEDVIACAC